MPLSNSATEPARRRGRPKIPKEVQRRRLLTAAGVAFDEQGYERTRVADIVAAAGMSSRSFYEFFDSKEDLIASVVSVAGKAVVARLREILSETRDPVERIDRGLQLFLDLFSHLPVDLESLGGAAGREVRAARRDYLREATQLVLGELIEGHKQGMIARKPDPVLVELVLTGVEGMAFRYYSESRQSELRELHPVIRDLLFQALVGA
jgi:AcrR family transcriptional regulator